MPEALEGTAEEVRRPMPERSRRRRAWDRREKTGKREDRKINLILIIQSNYKKIVETYGRASLLFWRLFSSKIIVSLRCLRLLLRLSKAALKKWEARCLSRRRRQISHGKEINQDWLYLYKFHRWCNKTLSRRQSSYRKTTLKYIIQPIKNQNDTATNWC